MVYEGRYQNQAHGQCGMADFSQSQSPVDDFSQDYEEVSVDIDLPDTEETQIVDSEEDQVSLFVIQRGFFRPFICWLEENIRLRLSDR